MARKRDGREELPPMHPRRLYPPGVVWARGFRPPPEMAKDGHSPEGDEYETAIAALEAQNLARARELLKAQRQRHSLTVETRSLLAAIRKAATQLLEAQGRAKDDIVTTAVINGKPVTETRPGPVARVCAALDVVERETLTFGALNFQTGQPVVLEWREWWCLDVEKSLTSRDIAELLYEHEHGRGLPDGDGARESKKRRDAVKAASKLRQRALAKVGIREARRDHLQKVGGAKR